MVIPAYERLLEMLKLSALKHPQLAHAINASVQAIEAYMQYTRKTRVYALAMCKVLSPRDVIFHV